MAEPETEFETPSPDQRRKVAEGLVAEARNRVAATNRILIAFFLLIMWSWLSNLSGVDLTEGKVGTPHQRLEAIRDAAGDLDSKCRVTIRNVAAEPPRSAAAGTSPALADANGVPSGAGAAQPAVPQAAPRNASPAEASEGPLERECRERNRRLISALQALNTNFDLLIIRLSEIHLKYHPILIVLMIGFILSYAAWNRHKVMMMLEEAVAIYRREARWKRVHSGILLHSVPFWLWPISSSLSSAPTHDDYLEFLAINPRSRFRAVAVNVSVVILLFVTFATVQTQSYLSQQTAGIAPEIIEKHWKHSALSRSDKRELERHYAELSWTGSPILDVCILFGIFVPALVFLLSGGKAGNLSIAGIGDAIRGRRKMKLVTRRSVLVSGGVALAFVATIPGAQQEARRVLWRIFPNPRFTSRGDAAERRQGSQLKGLERQALEMILRDDRLGAVQMLRGALLSSENRLMHPRTHVRLYDLLAGVSVRYDLLGELERLGMAVQAWLDSPPRESGRQPNRIERQLTHRLRAWRSANGAWRRRWRSPHFRWHRILLPEPPNNR